MKPSVILDEAAIGRALTRIAHEIIERNERNRSTDDRRDQDTGRNVSPSFSPPD